MASVGLAWVAAALSGCATPAPPGQELDAQTHWTALSVLPAPEAATPAAWKHKTFPSKLATEYRYGHKLGRAAVSAHARSSVSMLRRVVHLPPQELGDLRFSWLVPQLNTGADIGDRDRDDSVVRIVLAFDGDRSRLSQRDTMLSELSRALTGEEIPYATLVYVWGNRRAKGDIVIHPRTPRVRKIVVESGPTNLDRWMDYRRDVRADFERAFGEPPGPLVAIAIMTDSDNTKAEARAWYGPISLSAKR